MEARARAWADGLCVGGTGHSSVLVGGPKAQPEGAPNCKPLGLGYSKWPPDYQKWHRQGTLLEMQNLSPHPDPDSESVFQQDPQEIYCRPRNISEALL